jgi:hypothetical protein
MKLNKKTTHKLRESERTHTTIKVNLNIDDQIQNGKFFKTNIDDKFSKDLLTDAEFRSRLGLKVDEKLNILLLKQSLENEESQLNENLRLDVRKLYNNKPTTTLSWLEKLKAKLSSGEFDLNTLNSNKINQINFLNANKYNNLENSAESYDWSYVLSKNYKKGMKLRIISYMLILCKNLSCF